MTKHWQREAQAAGYLEMAEASLRRKGSGPGGACDGARYALSRVKQARKEIGGVHPSGVRARLRRRAAKIAKRAVARTRKCRA